jgi:predicted nucleic acid-binding protein
VKAVSNTGPLIALAKVDRLDLLPRLFETVEIPLAVHRELLAKSGPEAAALDRALRDFVQVVSPGEPPLSVTAATSRLDAGERQAVALAYQRRSLLLMDDMQGRAAARRLGLAVTGVVGVLVQCKAAGALPAVGPLLRDIRQQGYWLSDEMLEIAAKLAGEV